MKTNGAGFATVLAAALAPMAAGCTQPAQAAPGCAERPVAEELAVSFEGGGGERVELRAGAASLDPGFPEHVGGTFDDAALDLTATRRDSSKEDATVAAKEPAEPASSDLESFSVRARHMRYDSRGGAASFSGDVQVELGETRLSCDTLEVRYHRDEGTVDFVADGSVHVERPGLVATAGKAQYEGEEHSLTLTESPRVEGDMGVLEGARIVLDVEAETVTVEEVRGTFRVQRP
ncbi:MAG: hypothetical protein HY907_13275 [Deltaproteobacteria bacterium]|nr:hypothetical protein [Deltaproteobacteria bacterium]